MPTTWTATLWYDEIQPEDHDQIGLARMIWQYRGEQPRLQGMLMAFLDQIQSIEDVTWEVLTGIWPLTAVGTQLDVLGEIVNQERGELADAPYRLMILGRIFVNHMNGTIPEYIELFDILGLTETIYISESYPCCLRIDATDAEYGDSIGVLVLDAAPAGVDVIWIWNPELEADSFAMSNALDTDEINVDGGFANAAGTIGGQMSGDMA